jgi:hypothetical protein
MEAVGREPKDVVPLHGQDPGVDTDREVREAAIPSRRLRYRHAVSTQPGHRLPEGAKGPMWWAEQQGRLVR